MAKSKGDVKGLKGQSLLHIFKVTNRFEIRADLQESKSGGSNVAESNKKNANNYETTKWRQLELRQGSSSNMKESKQFENKGKQAVSKQRQANSAKVRASK